MDEFQVCSGRKGRIDTVVGSVASGGNLTSVYSRYDYVQALELSIFEKIEKTVDHIENTIRCAGQS